MKKFELGPFKGFPRGIDDIQYLNDGNFEAQMTFLYLAAIGFNPAQDCIITGCEHESGVKLTGGLVYIGGHIIHVPETATALTTGNLALRKELFNPISILWEDGQSRDSIYEYRVLVEQLISSPGQIPIFELPRLHRRLSITFEPDWQVFGPPTFEVDVFKGRAELIGDVQWTGALNNAGVVKIGTLPLGSRPYNQTAKLASKSSGTAGGGATIRIFDNGDITWYGGEINTNDVVCLDGLRWEIFSI